MSPWTHLTSPASRLLVEMRQALRDGPPPGARSSMPRHEAFALGLGLAPVKRGPDYRA